MGGTLGRPLNDKGGGKKSSTMEFSTRRHDLEFVVFVQADTVIACVKTVDVRASLADKAKCCQTGQVGPPKAKKRPQKDSRPTKSPIPSLAVGWQDVNRPLSLPFQSTSSISSWCSSASITLQSLSGRRVRLCVLFRRTPLTTQKVMSPVIIKYRSQTSRMMSEVIRVSPATRLATMGRKLASNPNCPAMTWHSWKTRWRMEFLMAIWWLGVDGIFTKLAELSEDDLSKG